MSFRGSRGRRDKSVRNQYKYVKQVAHDDNNAPGEGERRHPPHLKGKEIGLFYAKRSKAKKLAEKKSPKLVSNNFS